MQIYLPFSDLIESARYLDDKRLNKQIIELYQILSTAFWKNNCDEAETLYAEGNIYLPTHENHPVVKWVANSQKNFQFAIDYIDICCLEYQNRFCKTHSCEPMWFIFHLVDHYLPEKQFKVPQNFTTNHKHISDVHEAYRKELQLKWKNDIVNGRPPKWTNTNVPEDYKWI